MSSEEITSKYAALPGVSLLPTREAKAGKAVELYSRAEFDRLGILAGHTTAYGYCVHDFSAAPCSKHEDCIDCPEQFCVKGDAVRERNLRKEFEEILHLISRAEIAAANGAKGAERWLEFQRRRLDRIREMLALYDNPEISIGAIMRIAAPDSRLHLDHQGVPAVGLPDETNQSLAVAPAFSMIASSRLVNT